MSAKIPYFLLKGMLVRSGIAVILTDCIARCFGGKKEKNTEILMSVAHVVSSYFRVNIDQTQILTGIKNNIPSKIESNKQKRLVNKQS